MQHAQPVYTLFTVGIASIAIGEIAWVVDLSGCALMQSLPFNPQLHAFGEDIAFALIEPFPKTSPALSAITRLVRIRLL